MHHKTLSMRTEKQTQAASVFVERKNTALSTLSFLYSLICLITIICTCKYNHQNTIQSAFETRHASPYKMVSRHKWNWHAVFNDSGILETSFPLSKRQL